MRTYFSKFRGSLAAERGAGTVLAIGFVLAAIAVLTWATLTAQIGRKQLEAQVLADRIALAADDALRGKTPTPPCDLARAISAENSAVLDTCRIVETKVFIELHIYIDFFFSQKAVTLSLKASAAAEPEGLESSKFLKGTHWQHHKNWLSLSRQLRRKRLANI